MANAIQKVIVSMAIIPIPIGTVGHFDFKVPIKKAVSTFGKKRAWGQGNRNEFFPFSNPCYALTRLNIKGISKN